MALALITSSAYIDWFSVESGTMLEANWANSQLRLQE
jgi:hypothetical protein